MFPVACAHCILDTKFTHSFSIFTFFFFLFPFFFFFFLLFLFFFFFKDQCVYSKKSKIAEKSSYKMISWPEHAKDISYIYLYYLLFLNDVCIQNWIPEKSSYKMISWPEHAEDISYIYLINQIPKSFSDLFAKKVWKRIGPYQWHCFFLCISTCSVDKKIACCWFSTNKMKNKKHIKHSSFWIGYWKHYFFFFCFT